MRAMLSFQRRIAASLAAFASVHAAPGAAAHHSIFAEYDRTQTVEFVGILTAFHFANPHVWYIFDEELPDGSRKERAVEAGTPSQMRRVYLEQFHRESLAMQVGAKYTVKTAPSRTEPAIGFLKWLQLPDGKWLYYPPAANP
jgi:hypothetical protein